MDNDVAKSAKEHNKKYLGLTEEQYLLWRELMECTTGEWQEEMRNWLLVQHKGEAVCTEAIGTWVADWIKYKFPIDFNCPHYYEGNRKRFLRPSIET